MNFELLCINYLDYIKLKRKPQSYRTIKSRINSYILPYFKKYNIQDITPIIYLEWQKCIETKKFSYKYKKSLHYTMVALINFSIDFYNVPEKNIASKVGNFVNNEIPKEIQIWNTEEYKKFINSIDELIYKNLFRFLYVSGVRLGESLALTFNDIDNDIVIINKTISKENINGVRIITTPKTKKSIRKIQIDTITKEKIFDLKKYYTENYENFNNNFYIFGGNKPLSPTTIERKKNYYCEKAGVKKIRLHDFRHSHATFLLSNGVPITEIASRLGHSDISMTLNTYSHILHKDEKRVIKLLNSLI